MSNEKLRRQIAFEAARLMYQREESEYYRAKLKAGKRRSQAGFSLIELLVVVTIIGLLAGIAMVQVKYAIRKAQEAALKENLHSMRTAIDNFYADKQRYPANLEELVPNYLKSVPKDPITMNADWEEVMEEPDPDAPENTDAEGNSVAPGMSDVRSRAQGSTLDDIPYTEL